MNKNVQSWKNVLALLVVGAAMVVSTRAGIVYDNSTTFSGYFYNSTNEYGDQIKLSGAPYERIITQFKFEYYLNRLASGNETVQLRLYSVDTGATVGGPLNLLYTSDVSPALTPGYNTFKLDGLNLAVPDNIIWTVQFSGITGTEVGGLLFYNTPAVGTSYDDFWEKAGGVWTSKRETPVSGPIANFGAQITAVPEPTTIQFALLAGLAWLGMTTYRRR